MVPRLRHMPGSDDTRVDFARAESELLARWPENKVAPDLGRISALMSLLGEPQLSAPVIHIAGTNGKTSTARIIESLMREHGLKTGLFTSPSLESITERVQIDGEPVSPERFAETYSDIAPLLTLLDEQAEAVNGPPVTMFEAITALAFACFADAPVDVMIIECGMGGAWDATNVVEPAVVVVTPIGLDHTDYLGDSLTEIATEKAGIIKQGSLAAFARQEPEAAAVLMARCAELGIIPVREGVEFAVVNRSLAVGGQMLTVQGLGGEYDDTSQQMPHLRLLPSSCSSIPTRTANSTPTSCAVASARRRRLGASNGFARVRLSSSTRLTIRMVPAPSLPHLLSHSTSASWLQWSPFSTARMPAES